MDNAEKIIGFDFQGWPVKKLTFKDLFEELGCKLETHEDSFTLTGCSKLLNAFPIIVEDDGMGYGVNEQYVVECSGMITQQNEVCVFTDCKTPGIERFLELKTYPGDRVKRDDKEWEILHYNPRSDSFTLVECDSNLSLVGQSNKVNVDYQTLKALLNK